MVLLRFILVGLFVLFILFDYVSPQRPKKCPNGLVLNEIFTLGQHQSAFSGSFPYIELARSSDGEINLDKYSIAIYGLNKQNLFRLRALMDLKSYRLLQGQKVAVIGDGNFPNKLTTNEMMSSSSIFLNARYNNLDFLSVGTSIYLVVTLMYSGEGKCYQSYIKKYCF